jgi:Mrp family chromosome partitioning ATPase
MHDLATRSLAAGGGGLTKVGVVSVSHGEGTTTIARSLAACLVERFGQRVVLVEANQRSPCLRHICGLTQGPSLSDVLGGSASLESALRVSGSPGKLLVLPATMGQSVNQAPFPPAAWRDLAAELFFYADALVLDLAPLGPYPDSLAISRALDGVALVMRAGRAKRAESALAIEGLKRTGVPVLGAVLNRERRYVPKFLERML